jgi:hypothetical protein
MKKSMLPFHCLINNSTIAKDVKVPITGGMQNWKETSVKNISLKKGTSIIRVLAVKGGFNLSAMQFEKQK